MLCGQNDIVCGKLSHRHAIILIVLLISSRLSSQGYFTIIDDDISSIEAIRSVKNVADKKSVKITFAATVEKLLKYPELSNLLLDYQKEGHQIVNHGWTHSSQIWENPKWEKISLELDRSEKVLDSLGFNNFEYLVFPFGKYPRKYRETIINNIKERYKLAFNSRGHYCNLTDFNKYYIPRFAIRKHNNDFAVRYWLRKASNNNAWVVFLNHSGNNRDYSEDYLSFIIDNCIKLGMINLTVEQAYSKFSYLQADSTIEDYSFVDEVIDVLFLHVFWVLFLFLFICMVFFLFCTRKKKVI